MTQKLKWLWVKFWGKKYDIIKTRELKENEILIYKHKIYLGGNLWK